MKIDENKRGAQLMTTKTNVKAEEKPNSKARQHRLAEADVAAYLEEHPDFFVDRENLLLKLDLPTGRATNNGEAVSLVERQVSLLRERSRDTRKSLDDFLLAAKHNDDIFRKCQQLILALIEARDTDDFFKALETSFKKDFKSEAYSLIVFSEYAHQINHFTSSIPEASARKFVGGLMRSKEPYLGVLRQKEQDFLFRHSSANVRSAAVLPVKNKHQIALLAIGSSDPNYFKSGLGTLFIGFIADVIARLLPRFVYLNPK